MSSKVIPSDGTHRDSHRTLYKGDHWDHHFSLLPFFVPLSFLTVPNAYSWRDPVLSLKALYSLLIVYQTLKSINFWRGLGELRKIEKRKVEPRRRKV